eukprot:310523-Chlamydomonas_euryale.AAC.3
MDTMQLRATNRYLFFENKPEFCASRKSEWSPGCTMLKTWAVLTPFFVPTYASPSIYALPLPPNPMAD